MDEPESDIAAALFVHSDVTAGPEFRSRFVRHEIAALQLIRASAQGGGCKVMRTQRHLMCAPAEVLFACVPLEGEARLEQGGRTCILSPGDLGLLDARAQYEVDVPDGANTLWLLLDPVQLETRLRDLGRCTARRINGARGLGLVTSSYIRSTVDELHHLPRQSAGDVARILIDLVAAACAEAAEMAPLLGHSAAHLNYVRACKFIDCNFGDETLSPAKIAAGVGISRRYLSEIFASEGQTPMGYVTQRRLAGCYAELQNRRWRPGVITKVAFGHGYSNLSSFNRSFKLLFGRSPRQIMDG